LGLKTIEDGLLLDQSYFEANQSNSGDFDNDPLRPYNLMPSALSANFNTVDFTLAPNSTKGSVDISFNTLPRNVVFENQMKLVYIKMPKVRLNGLTRRVWLRKI
jgi:D-alanyl-D-alanine carboxypeptidase/D-alanyl-D-alanine-endopeptidase (penicillin-binding protein 4)